ncbi:hypothetical protein [Lysobacter capsici]|uniref:hypothetical protein n=1 Tax=Lysobacter capsici TaxID=435897 RepID=UPI00128FE8BF|nr:hypothetical protein [Lysobacter capsici]
MRALDSQKSIFLWLPFFCCFRQKKVTRRFSGGTLLILLAALKASKLQSSRAFEAKGKINSFRPQAAELLSFVKSDKRKVTKEKRFSLDQVPARAVQTQACATRDILSRWRTAHIHVRRPTGVLLFSRAPSFAALDELRHFTPEPNLYGLPVGAAQAATAGKQPHRKPRRRNGAGRRSPCYSRAMR